MNVSLGRSSVDVTSSAAALGLVALLLTLVLDPRPPERAAHLWGRLAAAAGDSACPTVFGNEFWFSCASEMRRRSG